MEAGLGDKEATLLEEKCGLPWRDRVVKAVGYFEGLSVELGSLLGTLAS